MTSSARRVSLIFSNFGHFYVHLLAAYYAVIVLQLERDWNQPYEDLLRLWTLGSLLIGLAAIPAGRLADRLGSRVMMVAYFIGMGGAFVLCGFMDGATGLMLGLALVGTFAAIYHPVGIPWIIRTTPKGTGKALAVNGIFGSFGTAAAGLIAGGLSEQFGWRTAFIVPGAVCFATGLVLLAMTAGTREVAGMREVEGAAPREAPPSIRRPDLVRVFVILVLAVFVGGTIYNTMQNGLPKIFSEQLGDMIGEGAMGPGAVTSIVFLFAGVTQVVGGILADRYPLKYVFILCWVGQTVFVSATAAVSGVGLVGAAALLVMSQVAAAPAESMLVARYAPEQHHGLAFGGKFVASFLAAPVSVQAIALVREFTGDVSWLLAGLGVAALMIVLMLFVLPGENRKAAARAAA